MDAAAQIVFSSTFTSTKPNYSAFFHLWASSHNAPDASHFPVRDSGVSCHHTALIPRFFHRLIAPSSLPSLIGLTGHLPAFILLLLNGFLLPAFLCFTRSWPLSAATSLILYHTYKAAFEAWYTEDMKKLLWYLFLSSATTYVMHSIWVWVWGGGGTFWWVRIHHQLFCSSLLKPINSCRVPCAVFLRFMWCEALKRNDHRKHEHAPCVLRQ